MSRPPRTIRSIEKNICFDEPLVNRVDLILYSELEGRVPHGAWKRFLQEAVEEKLVRLAKAKAKKKEGGGK